MRRIETSDFESLNVEFVEFWVLDPFINDPAAEGGDLYFNLGNISEDVLKDGRKSLENALPVDGSMDDVDQTVWRSEEHTSELKSLMRISYAVFCLKKKIKNH